MLNNLFFSDNPIRGHDGEMWTMDFTEETSILIPGSSSKSHVRFFRKWNQLSRLQRSLIYALILLSIMIVVLWLTSKTELKSEPSGNLFNNVVNATLVIQRAESAIKLNTISHNVASKKVTMKQNDEASNFFNGPTNDRMRAVVESFQHAWRGYKNYAWGHDNLKPLSGGYHDWFSLGLTIIDSLDTAYIMGLKEEYQEGREWVKEELKFTKSKDVNFFEVTIRVLGGLLSNYYFTRDAMFLEKADDLGTRLLGAVNTPSGIPYSDVNLATKLAHGPEWMHHSTTAEVTTVQLEFKELSRATGKPKYEEAVSTISEKIHNLPKRQGLVPIFVDTSTGKFVPSTITLGARGDSYYEYLLKQWLQTGKTIHYLIEDYMTAMEGVRDLLAKRTPLNKYLFIGELSGNTDAFNPKMDHLTCYLPGTLALGYDNGMPAWHMEMAVELMRTCYQTYAIHPTFIAPEITHFNMGSATEDMFTKNVDAHSLLRPEFIESLWYMYQITGNVTYQEWGWKIFQAFQKHARVDNGFTSLNNVKSKQPTRRDMMESFFLAETLKYLYLLFSENRYLLDLKKFVINSEAHPLPIYKY